MTENRDSSLGFLGGVLVGTLLGASVAIMLAPDSGENTRSALKGRANEYKDKFSTLGKEYKERFSHITAEYRQKLNELIAEARERRAGSVANSCESDSCESSCCCGQEQDCETEELFADEELEDEGEPV
ncbi:MAG: YtxH domain-containing protein [bacterium]|nr:YtxH domain-containing protein [bacterium]